MEAMNFTRVSILNSTAKANVVPRFTPLSFSQKASKVCFTSSSKLSQRKHAIQVTNSTKGDDPVNFVADKIKEANEKLKTDVTDLKEGTDNLVGKAIDDAGKLKDDIEAKANETAGKSSDSIDELKDKVTDVVSDLDKNAKQNNEDLKKNIEDTAANVSGKAEEGKSELEKLAGSVVEKTNEAVVNALDAQEGTTKKIKEAFVDLTQDKSKN